MFYVCALDWYENGLPDDKEVLSILVSINRIILSAPDFCPIELDSVLDDTRLLIDWTWF